MRRWNTSSPRLRAAPSERSAVGPLDKLSSVSNGPIEIAFGSLGGLSIERAARGRSCNHAVHASFQGRTQKISTISEASSSGRIQKPETDAPSEPMHLPSCPVPRHPARKGSLIQAAYALFLFVRDIGDNDLIA
jgi:hypothetical protein